ncbi:hypothetical protein B1813_15405 [Saccharomonospora piscinae]|uniref:Uncharacterized protein n=2 Tax=Saccharomonospora piscinae TaxID=687388 RepID=A0A1V9A268_SACPI|nr:hypothetical protein [Saccharomonospora piscinae]OQO91242.1 hypothetical protein B1813_15405 [Saccharomonospora piscinae]TLW93590.1 hypothetical protein FFT09_09445 [Saccharomonospora piscinae]
MPRRVASPWASTRRMLCVLAVAFLATATAQAFLAASTTEWWPGVLAVTFTAAAGWCLATALTSADSR